MQVIARDQMPAPNSDKGMHQAVYRKTALTVCIGPIRASEAEPVQVDTISNPVVVHEDFMLGIDSAGYPYPIVLSEFAKNYVKVERDEDVNTLGWRQPR